MTNRDQLTISRDGDWRKIVRILQPGQKALGTVRRGNGPWAVLAIDEYSGTYVHINVAGTKPLNARAVRAALGEPQPVGQPRKGSEVREVYSVRLEPSVANYLRELGGNNLSEGIMRIAGEQ